ncbi:MAG: hypothetical protein K2H20_04630, partial [Bacilli bacterium]|nr:hypothetical protein [Bacilli bacterium]
YLECQKELSVLKEYCKSSNDEEFYFFVHQARNENPDLYCEYMKGQNQIESLIQKVKEYISSVDVSENTVVYENGILKGMKKSSPISILPEREKEFEEQVKKVFSTDFISSANETPNSGIKSLCESGTLYLGMNNIRVIPSENFALPSLFYSPLSDTITLTETDSNFKVSEYGINRIMEMYFFYDSFNNFHLTSMNRKAISGKKLVIEPFKRCKKIELGIEEEQDCIKLSKTRK